MVNRLIRQTAADTARAHAAEAAKARATTASSEDALDRGQVTALLELLKEAIARARFVAVDATLHGLCGDQGVNAAGLRWAAERLAEELVDPGPAAARVALATRPHDRPKDT